MADPKLCGTYRVLAPGLSVSSTLPGVHKRVKRPGSPLSGNYEDSDEQPTLITLEATDEVNIQSLLDQGSIVPWSPPKSKRKRRVKADG
jgi:hypothetical protein